jgi:hypothetical protein
MKVKVNFDIDLSDIGDEFYTAEDELKEMIRNAVRKDVKAAVVNSKEYRDYINRKTSEIVLTIGRKE